MTFWFGVWVGAILGIVGLGIVWVPYVTGYAVAMFCRWAADKWCDRGER